MLIHRYSVSSICSCYTSLSSSAISFIPICDRVVVVTFILRVGLHLLLLILCCFSQRFTLILDIAMTWPLVIASLAVVFACDILACEIIGFILDYTRLAIVYAEFATILSLWVYYPDILGWLFMSNFGLSLRLSFWWIWDYQSWFLVAATIRRIAYARVEIMPILVTSYFRSCDHRIFCFIFILLFGIYLFCFGGTFVG